MASTGMNKKNRGSNYIVQAGILAAAGMISRIIGLLYRGPLTSIIGDEGNGYYTSAYNIYTIILLISSYSIPAAVSKVIAQKLAVKEYRNAHRIFICSLWYVIAVGGFASLFVFLFADLLVKGEATITVLKIFAPTIFLSGLLGVLRGYFQAHKTMLQTSVSQILEQILNAVVSILAAYLFINIMLGSMDVYVADEASGMLLSSEQIEWNTKHAMYGAAGSALGTGAGVLVALLFMFGIYMLNREMILRRVRRDTGSKADSYGDILKLVLSVVTPFILSTAIYNFSTSLNQTIYTNIVMSVQGMPEAQAYRLYGIYGGKAVVISNIPIALASAMSSAILPGIAAHYAKKELKEARTSIADAIRSTMLIAIPAAVGLCVLSKPVTQLLFPYPKESLDMAAGLLSALAISIVFYTLSTLTNAVLQGIGKVNIPVFNAAAALFVQTAVLLVLLMFSDLGLYSLVISNIVYSGTMCLLNGRCVKRHLNYRQERLRTYVIPFLAASFMGAAAFGIYHGLNMLVKSNIICLTAAILIAVAVYFVLVIKFGGINEEELKKLPKGRSIYIVAKKMRLMK